LNYRDRNFVHKHNPSSKDPQQAPTTLINSYKAAFLRANRHEAPSVRYSCGRYYVSGTTGTGMTGDQFSSLVTRLQSRASHLSQRETQPFAR
jgi:hypothetical protein